LMPDLLIAHHFAAMSAFLLGTALAIGMKWLTGKLKKGKDGLANSWLTALIEALVYAFIAGVLIGSGFVAGIREGLLLTAALTVAMLALCLVSLPLLQQAGSSRQRVILFLLGLTLLILTGAASGATLLWGRSEVDLDLLYAFGMAVILLWALETLIEAREDETAIHTLFFFFIGTMLFIFLASWFGRAHADHPGAKQNRVGYYLPLPDRRELWDIHLCIQPPPAN
jgi:zinc transporter, ZIP family